jgi:hypothetical protein
MQRTGGLGEVVPASHYLRDHAASYDRLGTHAHLKPSIQQRNGSGQPNDSSTYYCHCANWRHTVQCTHLSPSGPQSVECAVKLIRLTGLGVGLAQSAVRAQ